ncbi:PAS domain-containing sensor histidine kinase [uncultured Pontibacter sp.]|uniref:PAS domain-containing sensor histidine kinase n=1 Tax=uncultured Pontibacter sp. TaxID=453356 RepID=UPI00262AA90D|nr:PAS domain-containing sensor histidine kinase [uncultured Pontibacter sp.]
MTSITERMVKNAPDMFCCIDKQGRFVKVSEASKKLLGYAPQKLEGEPYIGFVYHPDRAATLEFASLLMQGQDLSVFENSYICESGKVIPLRWTAQWSSSEELMFCYARDASELAKSKQQLEESINRYKALFENNPDLIFLEDKTGAITEVNKAFCEVLGVTRDEIIGQQASVFLPPEMSAVNHLYFKEALCGSTLRFDISCQARTHKQLTFDAIKFPVQAHGQVIGVQTIAKDITPIVRSFETISRQTQKLNTIFESITDAFVMLAPDWKFTIINSTAEEILCLNRQEHLGQYIWDVYPTEVNGEFYRQYHLAVETGKAVHFSSYLQAQQIWLEVKAYPSKEGLSIYFDDVTEKVVARQELEKLSLVASQTTNGIIITDKNCRVDWVNDGFTRLTGYTLEEVKGKIPAAFQHSESMDKQAFELIKENMLQGKPIAFETLSSKKNGKGVWLWVQANPVYDSIGNLERYITIQTNITEQKKTQQELERLSMVVSRTDNGVIITDAAGVTEWVNEGFTRMTGYTPPEMRGKKPGDLLQGPESDQETIELIRQGLRQNKHFNAILLNYTKSGQKMWISMDITPIRDNAGSIVQYSAILRDITFRKEAEARQLLMTQDLYRQNRDLQQFTYIVSHNLRAPVANALGLVNLLNKAEKNLDTFDYALSSLKESIVQLDTVLKDVNMILGIRDKRDVLEAEEVPLAAIFWQACHTMQDALANCGGKVVTDIDERLKVNANRSYLYSIFDSLLSNAIKYRSEERQLVIEVNCFESTEGFAVISFSDNGKGFDTAKAGEDVFKLYKKFHNNTLTKGRGIGLFLVKTHVEVMGGKIEVYSQLNQGTKFVIHIPLYYENI